METLSFQGLGTHWAVLVDAPRFPDEARQAVLDFTERFEKNFSRFLLDSEVNAFREKEAGQHDISDELFILLERAEELRRLTEGAYDPAVAGLLERAGYGPRHEESARETVGNFSLPRWSLGQGKLVTDGPITFDLGGMGKGYCIDEVGRILRRHGFEHFLVDGGGDMYGTTKRDGEAWRVAVEYPGRPGVAAGTLALKHQGLAVSDRFRRRFGRFHHVVDWRGKKSVETVNGCAALAPNAWAADCMTSGLFLASSEQYPALAQTLEAEYLVFLSDGTARVSRGWPGELFT